jgi:hypothetical protein
MTTVRQIERQWDARGYGKLSRQLLTARPEASFHFPVHGSDSTRTAALALIRLEELNQSHVPLASRLVRTLISTQDADGGWGDPATTALCLRALLCCDGRGAAIERGMSYLAQLQKESGIWPAEPLRRMPEDAKVSAFILYQLGDHPRFRSAVRFDDAIGWFAARASALDPVAAIEWERAAFRCRRHVAPANLPGMS